jgi:hypothetical protein
MHQTIKNPTSAGGVEILSQSKAKSIKGNYTQTFKNKTASLICTTQIVAYAKRCIRKNNLVNNCKNLVLHSITDVLPIAKSGKNKYYNLQNLVKTFVNNNFISIIEIIITISGMNRTRQQAVFLRLLHFGLCYKLKTVYGGLREGNITPYGNTLRRLIAVIETCHPIKVVVLLNQSGGQK